MTSIAVPAPARDLWRFFTRRGGMVVIGAVLAGGAIAGGATLTQTGPFVDGGEPPDTGVANIWIDNDGSGSCLDSGTQIAYSAGNSCSSLNNASATCEGGDIVRIMGGNYSNQSVSSSNGRSGTSRCEMYEADGETVVLGTSKPALDVTANSILIDGIATGYYSGDCPSQCQGQVYFDSPSSYGVIQNSDTGVVEGSGSNATVSYNHIGPDYEGILYGSNWQFTGNEITEIRADSTNHNECVRAWGGSATFDGNWIHSCDTYGFMVKGGTDVMVQNNVFGPEADSDVWITNVDGTAVDCSIVLRNNTFIGTAGSTIWQSNEGYTCEQVPEGGPDDDPLFTGNLWDDSCCNGTYSAFPSGTPSGTNVVGDLDFIVGSGGDYDIGGSSVALGAGNPSNYPSTDRNGTARGNPPDSGAYEGP